uniref:ATP synthase F0 subunit 8 n=1 Tax=Illeis koebelei TaxID=420091 RepID=UPI00218249A8|nr:ATP synthase F0 subunit 8 [Illeis koebelei]UHJ19219.1 ATP synthase F0 subunit 8 [Illeis koebelei]UVF63300.1 ATP synthase F0 subunit 8 [Illeis koebelei]UXW88394.1 ATP synthase F0 subunit 8 [Illeis cincta]
MPQAMPIYWLNLFLMMTLIFMLINIKMYFNYYKSPLIKKFMKIKNLNWKW